MKINNFSIHDLDRIFEIEQQCFFDPWTKNMFITEISSKFAWFFTAWKNSEIVGYAGIRCVHDEGEITNIAILPEYQRSGVGSMLLNKLISFAKEKKVSYITLEVRKSNDSAKSLYLKNGFREIGMRKGYYENNKEDAVIMQLILIQN